MQPVYKPLVVVQIRPTKWVVASLWRETFEVAPGTPMYKALTGPLDPADALRELRMYDRELRDQRVTICPVCHYAATLAEDGSLEDHSTPDGECPFRKPMGQP